MNYYIQGNKGKAEEIEAAFEELGYNSRGLDFSCGFFYTVERDVHYCVSYDCVVNIIKTHPDYKELELPIEPCFKVADKIEATIYGIKRRVTIREVDKTNRCYFGTLEECIGFSEQDQWHLAPKPHYDIKNFKPFDKVLVRQNDSSTWGISFWGRCSGGMFMCCSNVWYEQCVPFEGNEHLLGTTDIPSEEYINW